MESPLVLLFFILKDSWLIKPHECCKVWSLSLESGSHPQDTRRNPPGLFRKTMENHGKPWKTHRIQRPAEFWTCRLDITSFLEWDSMNLIEIPWRIIKIRPCLKNQPQPDFWERMDSQPVPWPLPYLMAIAAATLQSIASGVEKFK